MDFLVTTRPMGLTNPWQPRATVPHRFRETFFDEAFEVGPRAVSGGMAARSSDASTNYRRSRFLRGGAASMVGRIGRLQEHRSR